MIKLLIIVLTVSIMIFCIHQVNKKTSFENFSSTYLSEMKNNAAPKRRICIQINVRQL